MKADRLRVAKAASSALTRAKSVSGDKPACTWTKSFSSIVDSLQRCVTINLSSGGRVQSVEAGIESRNQDGMVFSEVNSHWVLLFTTFNNLGRRVSPNFSLERFNAVILVKQTW